MHRFGPFRYDPESRTLLRDGEPVALAPKVADTLHVLLERRGHVVDKAELMKLVWPDCTVEEIGLARNISLLRKALGDESEAYVQTVPKRGYRFASEKAVAPRSLRRWLLFVTCLVTVSAIVYWQFYMPSRFVPGRGKPSLAVIPVECLSPDLEREAFPQSFTEAVAAEMTKLGSVQVISPGTVRRYQRLGISPALMARMLALDVVLEGAARRTGDTVRVAVRLSDVHSGKLIWAEGYDVRSEWETARSIAAETARKLR